MKALFIDPKERRVWEGTLPEDIDERLAAMREFIDCSYVTVGNYFSNKDALFIDDEGLFKSDPDLFRVGAIGQALAGRGIVVGGTPDGESVDVKQSVEELFDCLYWVVPVGKERMLLFDVKAKRPKDSDEEKGEEADE